MKLTPLAIASLLVFGSVKADAFVDDALAAHNEVRKEYGVPAYVWSTTLAKYAQEDAKGCHTKTDPTERGVGVNYALGPGFTSVRQAVQDWMKDGEKYNYEKPEPASDATNFVQLVWKSSRAVGCALVECPKNETPTAMVVCRYSPPGNTAEEYKDNVPEPTSK
ncbi:hypothetical protein BG000_001274 [Podila horticola]|nr:hypothetical protein BG000_001274 [Podila horticola]